MTTALKSLGLRSFPRTETSQWLLLDESLCGAARVTSQTPQGSTGHSGSELIGGRGVSPSEGQVGPLTCQGVRTLPPRRGKNARPNTCHLGH